MEFQGHQLQVRSAEHRGSAELLARAVYPGYLIHLELQVHLEHQGPTARPEHLVRAGRVGERTEPAAHREAQVHPAPPEHLAQAVWQVREVELPELQEALERAEIQGLRELPVRAGQARVLQVSAGHLVHQEPTEA